MFVKSWRLQHIPFRCVKSWQSVSNRLNHPQNIVTVHLSKPQWPRSQVSSHVGLGVQHQSAVNMMNMSYFCKHHRNISLNMSIHVNTCQYVYPRAIPGSDALQTWRLQMPLCPGHFLTRKWAAQSPWASAKFAAEMCTTFAPLKLAKKQLQLWTLPNPSNKRVGPAFLSGSPWQYNYIHNVLYRCSSLTFGIISQNLSGYRSKLQKSPRHSVPLSI